MPPVEATITHIRHPRLAPLFPFHVSDPTRSPSILRAVLKPSDCMKFTLVRAPPLDDKLDQVLPYWTRSAYESPHTRLCSPLPTPCPPPSPTKWPVFRLLARYWPTGRRAARWARRGRCRGWAREAAWAVRQASPESRRTGVARGGRGPERPITRQEREVGCVSRPLPLPLLPAPTR